MGGAVLYYLRGSRGVGTGGAGGVLAPPLKKIVEKILPIVTDRTCYNVIYLILSIIGR